MTRHDVYTTSQGKRIRVLHKNIFVKPDPLPVMTVSGLHMPVNAVESVNNSGTVVAYGFLWVHDDEDPDSAPRKIPIPDMEIGLRVMFIRFLGEVHTTKAMQAVIGDEIIKMDASDILAIGVP